MTGAAAAAPPSTLLERVCAEVREPIAHALAAAEGLKRLRLPDAAAAQLDTIAEAAEAALSLLDVAADLQKAEAGRWRSRPSRGACRKLMDDIEARWRDEAETAGVTLLVSYDGAPDCAAMIDTGRLMQVFDALIGHAMAHSQPRRDRGQPAGAPGRRRARADRPRARQRRRLSRPTTSPACSAALSDAAAAGGAGLQLELMLAERAIEAMSGTLDAKANPGPGATVSFDLAAEAAVQEAAPTTMRSAPTPRAQPTSWWSTTTPPTAWWSRRSARCSTARPSRWSTGSRRWRPPRRAATT